MLFLRAPCAASSKRPWREGHIGRLWSKNLIGRCGTLAGGQGSKGLKAALDAGVLAATAFVVYKGLFPLWVTCGGIMAAVWSAVAHTLAVLKL